MARPQRNNVDYFPFLCEEGNKMFYLEETYGNDGFAVFVKLLRELARTDNHFLNLSKPTTKMFISAKCKVSKTVLESIINDLVDLEKFDKELWEENQIIWCQDFIDSIQDAYSKRKNKCITRNELITLLIAKGIRKQSKSIPKPRISTLDSSDNPQSIEEYSIGEETKTKNTISGENSKVPFEERVKKFLEWFNKKKDAYNSRTFGEGKKRKSNIQLLAPSDRKNLKSLLEVYEIEDFNRAISSMFKSDWAIKNRMLIPSHLLVINNFSKYLEEVETPKDPTKVLHKKVSFESTGLES